MDLGLELMFVDFVNSEWFDGAGHGEDRLDHPGWLEAFTAKWFSEPAEDARPETLLGPRHLPLPAPQPLPGIDTDGLNRLRELRTALRRLADSVASGAEVPPELIDLVNRILDSGQIRFHLSQRGGEVSLRVSVDPRDAEAIATAVALSAAEFLTHADLGRLRECQNEGCRWVFYDTTKNGSRRWCDSRLCGNVDKVRRYRQRNRQSSPTPRTRGA